MLSKSVCTDSKFATFADILKNCRNHPQEQYLDYSTWTESDKQTQRVVRNSTILQKIWSPLFKVRNHTDFTT